jgi:hypothetical protein
MLKPIPSCLRLVWLSDFSTPFSNNCLTRFIVGIRSIHVLMTKIFVDCQTSESRKKKYIKLFVFGKYFWFSVLGIFAMFCSIERKQV